MKNLDSALYYQSRGIGVLPIKGKYGDDDKDSKTPLVSGWQDKHTPDDKIKGWFKNWPMANVGISTGPHSKLLVLDVDGLKGLETLKGKELPKTPMVITKRGFHHYYQWDDRLNDVPTTKVGFLPGLDSRGKGGYVVAPPSIYYDGTKYAWDESTCGEDRFKLAKPPEWFVQLLLISKKQVNTEGMSMVDDPWLTSQWDGVSTGDRHKYFVRYISYFIGKRLPADFTYNLLKEWNEKNDPPIEDEKFDSDFQDILQRFKDGRYKSLATPKAKDQTIEETAAQYLTFIEDRGTKPPIELTYGLPKLDELTGGIDRGNLEVIGALTKGGKTMFLLNVLYNNIIRGKSVVYFPTEMSNNEILSRYFAIAEGIPYKELKTGQLTPDNKVALKAALQRYKNSGFHIMRNYQPSMEDIQEAVIKFKPDILAIDYLQHCSLPDSGNKSSSMETFIKSLGELAAERNLALVTTAQPSKAKRDYKEGYKIVPMTMHDFADSSIIEKEASKIIIIHPGASTAFDRVRPIKVEVVNRHGESGEVSIAFDKDRFKFFD